MGSPLDAVRMRGLHLPRGKSRNPMPSGWNPWAWVICPTEPTSLRWFVDKVGMTLTLQMFEKSLCLNTIMFLGFFFLDVQLPPCSPHWGGEVNITSAKRCSGRRGKVKGKAVRKRGAKSPILIRNSSWFSKHCCSLSARLLSTLPVHSHHEGVKVRCLTLIQRP